MGHDTTTTLLTETLGAAADSVQVQKGDKGSKNEQAAVSEMPGGQI